MKILFDSCCPRPLRKYLSEHEVTTAQELGWETLKNGELLWNAQVEFDVMITTDSNIEYQQQLPDYEIALIVLRSVSGQVSELTTLMPNCVKALEVIRSGQCFYLFTDAAWEREQKRGKIQQRWLPSE
ncbi:MAG: hypothetical protein JST85_09870 [Acidobacteria bacterium]|nr:hypothetical protein [Acidobacteriota bacterium]